MADMPATKLTGPPMRQPGSGSASSSAPTGRFKGFIVLPKCWIVERTLGWANRARRIAKDFETLITSSQAWFMLAMSFLLIRRIARDYKKAA
jgi:transposase